MTQRTAGLDLEWERISPDVYRAILPAIPDYTTGSDDNFVELDRAWDIGDNGASWMFSIWLDLVDGSQICLFNSDFDISYGSFDVMMQAVEDLSVEDIADKLAELGYQSTTASRHATRRAASLDLNWWQTSAGSWAADLPAIPGYPTPGGGYYHVGLYDIVNDDHEIIGYGFTLNIVGPTGAVTLWNDEFGFGYADTEDEAKQEVESLSPEMIAQAAADHGVLPWADGVVSRKGKHMERKGTRRTASLDLEWMNPSEDVYQADLPAIPGYTGADGNDSFVTVTYDNDGGVEAVATIFPTQGGVVNLDCWDILGFIPEDETLEDVMQAVDDLDVYDISYQLDKMGIEPMVDEDGEYVTASRKATQRTARMDLNWDFNANMLLYEAALPAIPGYPGVDSVDVWKDDENDRWCFALCRNGYPLSIRTNEEFGVPSADTAEEMMDAVENLDPQEIADVLAANGYEPDEN